MTPRWTGSRRPHSRQYSWSGSYGVPQRGHSPPSGSGRGWAWLLFRRFGREPQLVLPGIAGCSACCSACWYIVCASSWPLPSSLPAGTAVPQFAQNCASAGIGVPAVGARDDRLLADLAPAVRAEVRAPLDRSAARASVSDAFAPLRDGDLEQLVDLTQPPLDRDHLLALLDQQVLLELVAPEHLEHQPAEVADALLARPDEGAPLAPERAGRRNAPGPRRRRRRALRSILRGPLAEPVEQGDSCHRAGASLQGGPRAPTGRYRSITTTRGSVSSCTE